MDFNPAAAAAFTIYYCAAFAGSCDSTLQWMWGERGPTQVSGEVLKFKLSYFLTTSCLSKKSKQVSWQIFLLKQQCRKKYNIFAIVQSTFSGLLKDRNPLLEWKISCGRARTTDPWITRPASSPFLQTVNGLSFILNKIKLSKAYGVKTVNYQVAMNHNL